MLPSETTTTKGTSRLRCRVRDPDHRWTMLTPYDRFTQQMRSPLSHAAFQVSGLLLALGLVVGMGQGRAAETALSVEDVLREALAANARLPLPALDVAVSREKTAEARAERWLKVAAEGDFIYAPPDGYDPVVTNSGETRLQLTARQALYDGGARRAAVSRAEADVAASAARYRIAEKDLELDVRSRASEFLQAESEIQARREGLERLSAYRTSLKSRQSAGQGVAADLLKTDVRLASEQASLVEAEARLQQARLSLNDLMGRDPRTPLLLAPLPPPEVVPPDEEPSGETPDVAAAEAEVTSAAAAVSVAKAERWPQLGLNGDAGLWGSDTSHLVPEDLKAKDPDASFTDRIRRDAGYSLGVTLSLPLWDHGAARARIAQAELGLEHAKRDRDLQARTVRLQWEQARAALHDLSGQIEILSRSAPDARDAYLEAESRYRGGGGTSLEVVEAEAAAVDLSVRLADAVARYRIARAVEARWGTP